MLVRAAHSRNRQQVGYDMPDNWSRAVIEPQRRIFRTTSVETRLPVEAWGRGSHSHAGCSDTSQLVPPVSG